jgi:phage gp36-like protein
VPTYIKTYCIDIAWYRLAQNNAPEAYSERYKNAIARLKDIEKGVMLIIDENGIVAEARQEQNSLIDNRGFPLDDWTVYGGECKTSFDNLKLY